MQQLEWQSYGSDRDIGVGGSTASTFQAPRSSGNLSEPLYTIFLVATLLELVGQTN